jgi:diaminohydroxyphosphoribosylaminopyrimidine deaminase/5-amino-6-(5-phosphoribosylamino)uracil reductase
MDGRCLRPRREHGQHGDCVQQAPAHERNAAATVNTDWRLLTLTDESMSAVPATERDLKHLFRGIELATRARGRTSPNPLVGAVIVKGDRVLGEGYHEAAGEPHAERMALAACTEDPAGATLYVSLEPCAHHGRTPPCTEAIVEAGIKRVVIASDDPSAKASGRGPGILRDEGIQVDVCDGEVAEAARLINQPFRKHARTGRPLVLLKYAMTLDGKVATRTGDSKWISSEASRARAHRWRADADAVAVGVGTAMADDPLLTARIDAVTRQPRRVVFDSEGRLPLTSQLVETAAEAPVILVCSRAASRTHVQSLQSAGVEVVTVSGENESARVHAALDELGARDVQTLLMEGGPHLAGAFIDADEVDELRVFVAPVIAGGRQAKPAVEGEGVATIAEAARAIATEVERIEDDVLVTARLREW